MDKLMKIKALSIFSAILIPLSFGGIAFADGADVVDVKITQNGDSYRFDVSVKHGDTGWDHYSNSWEVVGEDGTVYGTRVLAHPHENEQPFTRSQSGIKIPAGIKKVRVRAGDSVHKFSGKEMVVELPGR